MSDVDDKLDSLDQLDSRLRDIEFDVLLLKTNNVTQRTIQHIVDPVVVLSPHQRVLGCNAAAEKLLGDLETALIKKEFIELQSLCVVLFKTTLNIEEAAISMLFLGAVVNG